MRGAPRSRADSAEYFHSLSAETLTSTVVAVVDGDTITVLDALHEQHKFRISGIDAPEKFQPFGQIQYGYEVDLSVRWVLTERIFLLGVTSMA